MQELVQKHINENQTACTNFVNSYQVQSKQISTEMNKFKQEMVVLTNNFMAESIKMQEASQLELKTRAEAMERVSASKQSIIICLNNKWFDTDYHGDDFRSTSRGIRCFASK